MESGSITFDNHKVDTLNGYVPYHTDVDIEARLLTAANVFTPGPSRTLLDNNEEDTDDEPFLVEKVVQKVFPPTETGIRVFG